MIIIGERINGMFRDVRSAIKNKDPKPIQELAKKQTECGAHYLDVNVGPAAPSKEQPDVMGWMIDAIQEVVDTPLALDNPKFDTIKVNIDRCKKPPLINSTKCGAMLQDYIGLAVEKKSGLIALTMDESGVPNDTDGRVMHAATAVQAAMDGGLPMSDLFVDPIILPVNVDEKLPSQVLQAIEQIGLLSAEKPHIVLGLSNVSQGTKERRLINRIYLALAVSRGLDAAIIDPMDEDLVNAAITAELLMGQHIYCDSFLSAYRARE